MESTETRRRLGLARIGRLSAALALTGTLAVAGCSSSKSAKSAAPTPSSASVTDSASSSASVTTTAAASTPASSSAAGALTGSWTGDYQSAAGDDTGSVKATFAQVGNTLSGALTTDSVCFMKGSLTGTLSGTTVTLVARFGSETLTFSGLMNSPTGRNIQGTYKGVTHCGNGNGTFELGHTG